MQVYIYIPVICKQTVQIGLSSKSGTWLVPHMSQCVQLTIRELSILSSISSIDISNSLQACHRVFLVLRKLFINFLYIILSLLLI
jgi:hypothetical protein